MEAIEGAGSAMAGFADDHLRLQPATTTGPADSCTVAKLAPRDSVRGSSTILPDAGRGASPSSATAGAFCTPSRGPYQMIRVLPVPMLRSLPPAAEWNELLAKVMAA